MKFVAQKIPGVHVVEANPHRDTRGAFARIFCADSFAAAGIGFTPVQVNISANPKAGTLRGMHFQAAPHGEAKFVHAVRGRAFDAVVDLRPGSPTFRHWLGVELDSRTWNGIFIPEGCAHGFLTLEDDTDLLYHMGQPFVDGAGRGVRWNDPAFGIAWPSAPREISPRDAAYPDFTG